MVKFGKTLLASRRPGWEQHYLDYKQLKKALKQLAAQQPGGGGHGHGGDSPGCPPSYFDVRSSEDFADVLDTEVEKVVLFFLHQQGVLAESVSGLLRRWPAHAELASGCVAAGEELIELLRFLELNNTGLRKILKKHDKMIRDSAITGSYLSSRAKRPDSHLRLLSRHEGLGSLLASLRSGLYAAAQARARERLPGGGGTFAPPHASSTANPLHAGGGRGGATAMVRGLSFQRRFVRSGSFDGEAGEHDATWVLRRVAAAQLRLRHAAGFLSAADFLGAGAALSHAMVPLLEDDEDAHTGAEDSGSVTTAGSQPSTPGKLEDGDTLEKRMRRRLSTPALSRAADEAAFELRAARAGGVWTPSALLNLASTFLYMMNYYIVVPTSGAYAARLRMPPATSGAIVGCTPIAACVSAFAYSAWTNRSFRGPLLTCSALLVLGNVLYVAALPVGSCWPLLLGRFVNGLGGARGINRRYIADTVPLARRTEASAAFVTAGALGMAAGPGAAAALAAGMGATEYRLGNWLTLNTFTAPGVLMVALWLVYFVLLVCFFRDPERRRGGQRRGAGTAAAASAKAEQGEQRGGGGAGGGTNGSARAPLLLDGGANGARASSYGSVPVQQRRHVQVQLPPPVAVANPLAAQKAAGRAAGKEKEKDSGLRALMRMLRKDRATTLLLATYFVLKLVQEGLLTGTPLLATYYFGLSTVVEDRRLMLGTSALVLFGLVLMLLLRVRAQVGVGGIGGIGGGSGGGGGGGGGAGGGLLAQFVAAAVIVFSCTSMLEGVTMSLLSKLVPPALARGTFNSGLLATEAGTLGRAAGDLLIFAVGASIAAADLTEAVFAPDIALFVVVVVLIRRHFHLLY
eukprot:g5113.t1